MKLQQGKYFLWIAALTVLVAVIAPGRTRAACDNASSVQMMYNGPADGTDAIAGIAIQGSGNVVIVGNELGLTGATNWRIQRYDATTLTLLASTDFNGSGNGNDSVNAVAVDGAGNVVVVGAEAVGGGLLNWRIRKYDPTLATLLSTTDYNDPANGNDNAIGVAIDGSGSVYVIGYELGSGANLNWRIKKFNAALSLLVSSTDYNGPGNGSDFPSVLVLDAAGNVVVAGSEIGSVGATNWRVRRYDATLTTLLSNTDYNGAGNGNDSPNGVAVDGAGNVVVVGSEIGGGGAWNWRIRRYGPGLTTLLSTTDFDGPAVGADIARAVALESSGNIIVAGYEFAGGGSTRWRVRTYNPTLTALLSTTGYNGPGSTSDDAYAVAVDASGSVVAAGSGINGTGGTDWLMIRYTCPAAPAISTTLAGSGPAAGSIQVRNNIIRQAEGTVATILAKVPQGVTAVTFTLYSQNGLPIGAIGNPQAIDASGNCRVTFDGRINGKYVPPGLYYVVATGGVNAKAAIIIASQSPRR